MKKLKLAIDASNISQGGGLTHLMRLLHAIDESNVRFDKVVIWTSSSTAKHFPLRPWLQVVSPSWCDSGMVSRFYHQQFYIPRYVRQEECDVLFSPGGTLPIWSPVPTVAMSQNMLPFEPDNALLFGAFSPMRLKMLMLRFMQGLSFKRASGVLFLTEYARTTVGRFLNGIPGETTIIPHGIESRFFQAPREQRSLQALSYQSPFHLLYVSIMMPYKHQIEVVTAIALLRKQGVPVALTLVGAEWGNYGTLVRQKVAELDPDARFLNIAGHMPFDSLHALYKEADAFVFASSCENLPNILIEAMAAGLPILSSDKGPMPEVLGDSGLYFNPRSVDSICSALTELIEDTEERSRMARACWEKAQRYSWQKCAQDTLNFIAKVASGK